jgi:hypothetical protein
MCGWELLSRVKTLEWKYTCPFLLSIVLSEYERGGSTMIDGTEGESAPLLQMKVMAMETTGDGTCCTRRCDSNTFSTVNRGKPKLSMWGIPSTRDGQSRGFVRSIPVFLPLGNVMRVRYHSCRSLHTGQSWEFSRLGRFGDRPTFSAGAFPGCCRIAETSENSAASTMLLRNICRTLKKLMLVTREA